MTVIVAKWTIDEYHRMIDAGILSDRKVELLQGEIVEMSPEGEPHAYSSGEAGDYLAKLLAGRAKIRHAKPITLPNNSEPEPDIAIVQPLGREYRLARLFGIRIGYKVAVSFCGFLERDLP